MVQNSRRIGAESTIAADLVKSNSSCGIRCGIRYGFLAFLFCVFCSSSPAEVLKIIVNDTIHPITDEYIGRALAEAHQHNDQAILIELNTPGGLLDSTREIIQDILDSPVPVIIYVAPSGGRDRCNAKGEVEVAPFDPQSIELFALIAQKAGVATHFYPLALSTYHVLPPPHSVNMELGEARLAQCTPVHLYFGDEVDIPCADDALDDPLGTVADLVLQP